MHGEHLIEHIEERSSRLNRLGAQVINIVLGVCLGMLAAYAIRFRWNAVDFNIVGPLMGGAGGALARLLSKDFKGEKRQEKLRLEKMESASRLQMAGQIGGPGQQRAVGDGARRIPIGDLGAARLGLGTQQRRDRCDQIGADHGCGLTPC